MRARLTGSGTITTHTHTPKTHPQSDIVGHELQHSVDYKTRAHKPCVCVSATATHDAFTRNAQ